MNVSPRRALWLAAALLTTSGCGISDPTPHAVVQEEAPAQQTPAARLGQPAPPAGEAAAMAEARNNALLRRGVVTADQWTIEQTALDSLVRIGQPAVPALVQLLDDPNPKIRAEAVAALARIGSEASAAVAKLTALIATDPDETVRKYAVRALGQIGPQAASAVPVLVEQLRADATPPHAPGIPPQLRPFDQPASGR